MGGLVLIGGDPDGEDEWDITVGRTGGYDRTGKLFNMGSSETEFGKGSGIWNENFR